MSEGLKVVEVTPGKTPISNLTAVTQDCFRKTIHSALLPLSFFWGHLQFLFLEIQSTSTFHLLQLCDRFPLLFAVWTVFKFSFQVANLHSGKMQVLSKLKVPAWVPFALALPLSMHQGQIFNCDCDD